MTHLDLDDPYAAEPPPLPPRKKSRVWKILLLVIGIPLLAILALVSMGSLYEWTASKHPTTPDDRGAVLSIEHVRDVVGAELPGGEESFVKKKYFDDAWELEYEYESDQVYIYCMTSVEIDTASAKTVYESTNVGLNLGLGMSDTEMRDRDELFSWPDESRFGLIVDEATGDPIGNYFICRRGKRVIDVMISGYYFDEREHAELLLKPLMGRLDNYSPHE